jgi:hypothetical protein
MQAIKDILNSSSEQLQDFDYLYSLLSPYIYEESKWSWQKLEEIVPFLLYVSHLNIKSYIEIGLKRGGTFSIITAYLHRVCQLDIACGIDIVWQRKHGEEFKNRLQKLMPVTIGFLHGTSENYVFKPKFDLCLIDGDHTYDWAKKDWMNIGRYCKYCAFHDINERKHKKLQGGGAKNFWAELKTIRRTTEFSSIPADRFGIGLIHN